MEDGNFLPNTMLGTPSYSTMDFDYMDELFLERCMLQTMGGSEFMHQSPPPSGAVFDPALPWYTSEAYDGALSTNTLQNDGREERQKLSFLENLSSSEPQGQNLAKTHFLTQNFSDVAVCSSQSENYLVEGSQPSRRWWIEPRAHPGPTSSVMERLIRALGYIKDSARNRDMLIQIWVPVNRGSRRILTTNDQPFSVDLNCPRLASYRDISVNYEFTAEGDSKEMVGLPGRVFIGKVPEWTPDVRFFKSEEYLRVGHAQKYDIRGTLAVPVFEQGSRNCLGVIEVVMTIQKIKYDTELETVCKALEAFDLRSSEVSSTQNVRSSFYQGCNGSYQAALPEILEVLKSTCRTHRLPLAQTWVTCIQQGKGGSRHSNENYVDCVSTVDAACYVADPCIQGFHEACSEHHLLKGQGVAGQAFMTNQPCFSPDITSFNKAQYPLSHHAKMFGLHAAVAIRLRSIYTSKADFVLEFFLPMDCRDPGEQKKMLNSLSIIIQRVCQSLRIVTDKELEEETGVPVTEPIFPSDVSSSSKQIQNTRHIQSDRSCHEESSRTVGDEEVQESANFVSNLQKEKWKKLVQKSSEFRQSQYDSSSRANITFSEAKFSSTCTARGKRCTKAGRNINLQILQRYFGGSLKDAAKSIGVCPTTLKRICREHGIKRWPSRKIKKVGHSLQKLQLVIDSVQGASGVLQIGSFYSNFPELASSNLLDTYPLSSLKLDDDLPRTSNMPPDGSNSSTPAATSQSPSSSCSQSSSSSQCCSSGTQQLPYALNVTGREDLIVEEKSGTILKRNTSDAELHAFKERGPKLLPRSQSLKSFSHHLQPEGHPPLPKNSGGKSQEGDTRRVKVTYGEEKIRFRMQNCWRYKDLLQEIARRFGIDDTSGFHLKYLDDDSEWILLTCDADLEECNDLCQSLQCDTIKLSLLKVFQQHSGSPSGSGSHV